MNERFAVTAAAGALGSVLEKLTAMLAGDEYKLQKGTRREIMSIESKLMPVHDLLGKLWVSEDVDVACRDWMMEARKLSYDMEDSIDRFTLDLERGDSGFFVQRETMDSPFKEFMESINGVSNRCREMQTIADANICNRSKLTSTANDPRALFLHKDVSELVGMEEEEEELIKLMRLHETVCIVGFAGMGKTTLADLVYRRVADEFQCRAFVSMHPNPNMTEILGKILSQVTDVITSAGSCVTEAAAVDNIINETSIFLSDKRYLIIIDGIWHWNEWEVIRKALPINKLGCKIIMTTRVKTIAEECETKQGAHVYRYSFGYTEAARLSHRSLTKSGERYRVEADAKRLSSKIVDTCGAMPLAVICLSSAWAESHVQGDYGEWDTWVGHLMDDGFLSTPSMAPLVRSLSLGFDDLPVHLRTCLLYCSTYPRGYPIERDCLVRKWIAEGFVWQEELAEAYFDKLVSRNLLQPAGENIYKVHPLMLAFLVCKAKQDNFVVCRHYENGPISSSSHATNKQKIHRLSLYTDGYPDEDVSYHVRSLVLGPEPQLDGSPFKKFSHLRVLEIGSKSLEDGHLVDICGLMLLRYLGLKDCNKITELRREIERLQNLETLHVRRTRISKLPMEIEKLQHLRTLNISGTMVTELPREIGKLQSLETLDAGYTKVTELPTEIEELLYLKTLNVSGTNVAELPMQIEKLQHLKTLNVSGTNVTELPMQIEKLQHLKTLNVSGTDVTEIPREIGELQNLETLDASSTKVRELPTEIEKLQYLKTLNVSGTGVTELPREIGKLQNLETLNISRTMVTELPREINKLELLEDLDVSNTGVSELPRELRELQHLRTLNVRNTAVREVPWQIPNPLSVPVGGTFSVKVLKLPEALSLDWAIISSAGAACSCWGDMFIVFLDASSGSGCKLLPVPMLRVDRRQVNLPLWVKQNLCNIVALDIRLCKLGQDDHEFLKQMPNLQALTLRFEALPWAPIAITGGGFLKLETFHVDCRLPWITFHAGAMPKLKHLEFKFYSGPASNAPTSLGITHLLSLENVVFRCSGYYTGDSLGISATIDVVIKEAAEHPNQIALCLNGTQPVVFSSGDRWTSFADKAVAEKRERLSRAAESRALRERNRGIKQGWKR